ncbi:MAG TPA: hypothetical protein VGV87_03655, partial [Blastocatellia bacterium]|nr:hypothetical protein [Blastocatellia bacterium]
MSNSQTSAAIASVIEMGLINSTHVLAVITQNTMGSAWVPYEYGRVKTGLGVTTPQAACWIHNVPASPIPEYLYLGEVATTKQDLQ